MTRRLQDYIDLYQSKDLWMSGEATGEISSITSDSRQVSEGAAFFARTGLSRDGHDYLKELSSNPNIRAFFVERIPESFSPAAPVIQLRSTHEGMALACKLFYGDPSQRMECVAITGTNGKTTTSFLIQALMNAANQRAAVSGTVKTEFEGNSFESSLTTPDFSVLQKLLASLENSGATALSFEASSHALQQKRLKGIELDAAVFTNLTQDHLDYHETMENYFLQKKKLFSEHLVVSSKPRKLAILPRDGAYGSRLVDDLKSIDSVELWSWGFQPHADPHFVEVASYTTDLSGSQISLKQGGKDYSFRSKLVGRFNIENLCTAICWALASNISAEQIQEGLDRMPGVPGRLEQVGNGVFVDYAHTPDALENVLECLRPLTAAKLKVVFGCGGDRDKEKRPMMGEIAELYADEVYVTSDNPRSEDPHRIIDEILKGMQRTKALVIESDRKRAIELCLRSQKPGDVVLIAGKGHEAVQQVGDRSIAFDDREVAREILRERG